MNLETSARIELRTSADNKELLKEVAKMSGLSMTDFILTISLEKAKERLKELTSLSVNLTDYNHLMDAIDNPPEPTEHLQKTIKQFKKGETFEL